MRGPLTGFGLLVAAIVCVLDQAAKLWLVSVYDLGQRGLVRIMPGVDLVLTWNTGISYGLFPQDSDTGRWVLIGIKVVAVILLTVWLSRTTSRLTAPSSAAGSDFERTTNVMNEVGNCASGRVRRRWASWCPNC